MHTTEKNGCRTSYFRVFGTLRQNWDLIGTITGLWGLSPNFGTLLKALIKHFFFLQERRISSRRGCSENSLLWSLWPHRWRGWYWSRHCWGTLVIHIWREPSVVHNIFSVSTYLIYRYWSSWSFNDYKNGTMNRPEICCSFRRHGSRSRARNN